MTGARSTAAADRPLLMAAKRTPRVDFAGAAALAMPFCAKEMEVIQTGWST
jgi:hypothetical protein